MAIKLKRSGTTNSQPQATDLQLGELALNYADGKLYYKTSAGAVAAIGSGGSSYSLPAATTSSLGGVIVGAGLSISSGVLSATGTSSTGMNAFVRTVLFGS